MPPKKDDKKPAAKPAAPPQWNFDITEGAIVLLIILAIGGTVLPAIWNGASSGSISFFGLKFSSIIEFISSSSYIFKGIGFGLAGAGAVATFVFNKRSDKIWADEALKLYPQEMESGASGANQEIVENPMIAKWKQIVAHSESQVPSDWRLCIIEADIILEDLLGTLNLPGDTIGDKLKAVEKSDFLTLDSAWEAHKVRNQIAHEGSNFLLNQREARRVISLYEAVFKEFHII